ncbi:YsnF/AvaK domain-containing protein [Myxococcus qinghaiensis]|uniref:YsnF/AvaK domain-containing protein n=1 Tax=Myxococcus qinghaiensis TaxID=2906758 RepID=UPI0020A6E198|nr:YsnF/AvaK domain-containing protein [Myxococcus qinghaiensis]MCP3165412.1 YsnF/AvaK domain-containing protein [Myxococcus qinghaiensis]
MFQRKDVREGMAVRSIDNEKLGKVFAIGDDAFHIERGLFFPKDYRVAFSEVSEIRDGEVILNRGKEALQQVSDAERTKGAAGTGVAAGAMGMASERTTTTTKETRVRNGGPDISRGSVTPLPTANLGTDTNYTANMRGDTDLRRTDARLETDKRLDKDMRRDTEDILIPVHREKLSVAKRDTQAGELRVHKDVVEEEEMVKVPLRHERVTVERRAVTSDRPVTGATYKDETIVVPLHAEEVDITKRTVLDEEVVIHKDVVEEERRITEKVRHENVDIRTEGEVDAPRTLNATPDDPSLRRS